MEKVLIEVIGTQNIDSQFDKTELKTVGTFEELEEKYIIRFIDSFINQKGNFIMEIKEFIQNFADQFDDTDASVFTSETKFKELEEWSSLTALSVIAMIDEEYDVKIKGDDVRNSQTVNDLYEIVKSRL